MQRVGLAQAGEVLRRQLLGADPALRRGGRRRQVDVGHVGVDDLLGLEHLGKAGKALIGHLDDADVELEAAVAAGVGMAAGERVEHGGLAGTGEPHDGDLHARKRTVRPAPTGSAPLAVAEDAAQGRPAARRPGNRSATGPSATDAARDRPTRRRSR